MTLEEILKRYIIVKEKAKNALGLELASLEAERRDLINQMENAK